LLYACISIKKIKKYSKYYNSNYCNTKEDLNDFVKIDYWKNEWFNTLCGHSDISYIGFLIKIGYDGIFIDDCDF
jgi:endo-alpha-1,4-polygalactosaminidase (GH114 family)